MISPRYLLLAMLFSGVLVACSPQLVAPTATPMLGVSVSVEGGAYTDIPPTQLAAMLVHKDFILINTHIPYAGELASTDGFIPFEETGPQRVDEYPSDKNAKIVLYCRSGRMSTIVAKELVAAGYSNIWNLDGGMDAWEKAGLTLIRK